MKFIVLALAMGSAAAFAPMRAPAARTAVQMSAAEDGAKATAAALAAALAMGAMAPPAQAITAAERAQLSYLQVKGTGLANRCSTAVGGDSLEVKSGAQIVDLCLEPKAFFVEESVQVRADALGRACARAGVRRAGVACARAPSCRRNGARGVRLRPSPLLPPPFPFPSPPPLHSFDSLAAHRLADQAGCHQD